MLPPATVRGWYLDQLRKDLKIIDCFLKTTSLQDITTYRDGGTGWTVLEVLCHLRDYEVIFLERSRLTVTQHMPELPNPNPDALAAERRYNEQDVALAYAEWVQNRATFLNYLETAVEEADWAHIGVHPRRGEMTLENQLALIAWHDVNHIEQMTHILAEKKTG